MTQALLCAVGGLLLVAAGAARAQVVQVETIIVTPSQYDQASGMAGGASGGGNSGYLYNSTNPDNQIYFPFEAIVSVCASPIYSTVTRLSPRSDQLAAMQWANDSVSLLSRAIAIVVGNSILIKYADDSREYFTPSLTGAPTSVSSIIPGVFDFPQC